MTVGQLMAVLSTLSPETRVTVAGQDILAHGEAIWYIPVRPYISADGTEVCIQMIDDVVRNRAMMTFAQVLGPKGESNDNQ